MSNKGEPTLADLLEIAKSLELRRVDSGNDVIVKKDMSMNRILGASVSPT